MLTIRTDLAVEAHALWRRRAGETAELTGVSAGETACEGLPLTHVEILDEEGARTLGKPRGRYFTLDVSALWQREEGAFRRCALAVAEILEPLIPKEGPVLVAGLGNRAMTPDALGPRTVDQLLVTRHLGELVPGLRPVAALAAGVLGDTGMEAAEWVRGGAEHIRPAGVIVIDALAAGDLERLCSSIQISDAGLTPGSGVGNHRKALDRTSLGVPVISIGVPTVVDAATVAVHVLEEAGQSAPEDCAALHGRGTKLFVTPDGIDRQIKELSAVLARGISLALQPGLGYEDLEALLS